MATSKQRVMEGPLSKWTNVVHGWQYRWFVLDQTSGLLSYYTSKEKMKRGSRRATIQLKGAIIGIDDEDDCTFTIRDQTRVFHFQAQDSQEREKWVHALEACIRRLVRPPVQVMELPLPSAANQRVSLEQRLAEADGYYSLLRGQVQSLSRSLNQSDEARQLLATAKTMLEALQQTIDLLKDTQLSESDISPSASVEATPPPIGMWETGTTEVGLEAVVMDEVVEGERVEGEGEKGDNGEEEEVGGGESVTRESGEELEEEKAKPEAAVPESDSESESSEEFYDADEELEETPLSPMAAVAISVQPADSEADPSDVEEDQELHEDDDASSGVAQNRSIIMHMLSQARVGMDLTRITLPTFILEKRSLLEMYAEFFAHPDLFASIPDNSDPRERIIAIAKYYCSAFHAARKGAIAKKPYNPILGETFRCYWDLPDGRRNAPDENSKRLLQSGPVPYASYSSVAFFAEQVSHHPPVSGFYAECIPKRMYVNGSIYTKSKFLGLSLGVHNIGSVQLHLMDYGEEYRVNLPNAYARSILTVPWLELGGKCHIECLQNGYTADVEFHCKPFYGGRKHRITCTVNHSSERKPILKVEGEWNGVMYTKQPNGEQEVFVDTINTPTVKKKLLKLSAQDPGESRKRWQHVTESLLRKDIEEATDAKHALEEKQRADAKWRQENGVEWEQQHFHLEEDTWIYNTPLSSRMRSS